MCRGVRGCAASTMRTLRDFIAAAFCTSCSITSGRKSRFCSKARMGPAAHARLEVHAPHDPAPRAGVVVLHEVSLDAELSEPIAPIGLEEEAALVPMDDGLNHHGTLQTDGH